MKPSLVCSIQLETEAGDSSTATPNACSKQLSYSHCTMPGTACDTTSTYLLSPVPGNQIVSRLALGELSKTLRCSIGASSLFDLWCHAVQCSAAQHSVAQHSIAHSMAQHSVAQHSIAHSMAQHSTAWHSMA